MIELPVISSEKKEKPKRRPDWLRVKLPIGKEYANVRKLVDQHKLNTICQSGNCPNMGECWGEGTATFMILGNICTRGCSFCAVATGRPTEYDTEEPARVADAIFKMQVKHAVITSVNRDELKDRGAEIWYQTVIETKKISPSTTIETLIPDTRKNWDALYRMIEGGQEVISHNMETVKELYRAVRPQGNYERSLEHIKRIVDEGRRSKTGIMLGLGETDDQVFKIMDDLAERGLHVMTLGQYLQPTKMHHEVIEYIHPDKFDFFREEGLKRGIKYVESGPLVRSSYHAERHVNVPIK
ncbi:lipoyl synthase [Flammeovirga kamogawensis]|uniref:Lipoyl synthase n=1 Tax=Flammeovirga kamogawensis TaxID=373891 RepID=A0ABX8GRV5_9BACT|nr:lipoyl synthase [Flammeovirga kamogawensis]MBB6461401.1 lipoic acid synthetase [Flammeovirga kamogawensis]QWG06300.1 lipoyl synthase [Flammeovirga kamogawensis]TRX68129.1 lipoyl synthase [Flammeovirga kamogawensis]